MAYPKVKEIEIVQQSLMRKKFSGNVKNPIYPDDILFISTEQNIWF